MFSIFKENENNLALIWEDKSYTFRELLDLVLYWTNEIKIKNIPDLSVISIVSEPSPQAVALLLALINLKQIVVPLTPLSTNNLSDYSSTAEVEYSFSSLSSDSYGFENFVIERKNDVLKSFKSLGASGLILFSSGTTGKSKAILHDVSKLLVKYTKPRHSYSSIAFMFYDHIGGIDTLFYSLFNASALLLTMSRNPQEICRYIEKNKIEVLPTTPTFLKLLLLSEAHKEYDLGSLKYITYGAEPMPEYLLKAFGKLFPDIIFQQKYGITEIGTMRSKSESNDSLWFKVGGEGFQTRIVDHILEIKAASAMYGYLNAERPFTDDGWFITGDIVEQNGDYIKILGRESDVINVGGEKVLPADVENVIMQLPIVEDAFVYGEQNSILGNIVCAKVVPIDNSTDISELKKKIKSFCSENLEPYKVPMKILISFETLYSERFKKRRISNL